MIKKIIFISLILNSLNLSNSFAKEVCGYDEDDKWVCIWVNERIKDDTNISNEPFVLDQSAPREPNYRD